MSTDFEQRLRAEMEQVAVRPRPGLVKEAYRSYRGKRRMTRAVVAADRDDSARVPPHLPPLTCVASRALWLAILSRTSVPVTLNGKDFRTWQA
jgi:hypothetical protein